MLGYNISNSKKAGGGKRYAPQRNNKLVKLKEID
jgi:hypothetical protein